jgi:chromate transporter
MNEQREKLSVGRVFLAFLKLGLTSFGGPVAHLGYFRDEFVNRRRCLREDTYADLVALCQFLPGPASSQVGIGIGISQAGLRGGLAAWLGFTLPSAVALILFACLSLFFLLLFVLPLAARSGQQALMLADSFYRTGSLVFGGGHVVLPLLQAEVVNPGWISKDLFLAGYGAAQAVPGPLFTLAAYLGAASEVAPNGWTGGLLCLLAIFLPSFLLVVGVLPFWEALRKNRKVRLALLGVNAAVVGLLLAAFYDPVWSSGILSAGDFILALTAFGLLTLWKTPPWLVVGATGLGAAVLGYLGAF